MRNGKPLTRSQKEALSAYKLNWKDYNFVCDVVDDKGRVTSYFKVQRKSDGAIRLIDRYARKGTN